MSIKVAINGYGRIGRNIMRAVHEYGWLDRIVKVVVVVLTLSTVTATLLALPKVDWSSARLWPSAEVWRDPTAMFFVVALVGWLATRRLLAIPPIQVLNSA